LGVFSNQGVLILGGLFEAWKVVCSSDISEDGANIAKPAGAFQAKNRCATKLSSKAWLVPIEHLGKISSWNWRQTEFSGLLGVTIPGAYFEAFITSEKTVPKQWTKLLGYWARVFDGEIREATSGIEDVGLRKGLSGAGIDATGAGSAVIVAWTVVGDFKVGQD